MVSVTQCTVVKLLSACSILAVPFINNLPEVVFFLSFLLFFLVKLLEGNWAGKGIALPPVTVSPCSVRYLYTTSAL